MLRGRAQAVNAQSTGTRDCVQYTERRFLAHPYSEQPNASILLPNAIRTDSSNQESRLVLPTVAAANAHSASFIPVATIASASPHAPASVIFSAKWFQLFEPI